MNQIPDFQNANILVVGDIMLDKYWLGTTSRISPEAPVPVVKIQNESYRIGGAGNVAVNASTLGSQVKLLSLVGDDAYGTLLESMLTESGVVSMLHRISGERTITKLRVLSHNQQLIRLDFEPESSSFPPESFIRRFQEHISSCNAVILSDYAKGTSSCAEKLVTTATSKSKIVIVDPKGTDFKKYRGATIITPNISEFEAVVGKCSTLEAIFTRGQRLLEDLSLSAILVTRGDKGMALIQNDQQPISLPAIGKEVFDVTGAGDTVVAMLGAALGSGASLSDAVHLANTAASVVVGKLGTACVTKNELKSALRQEQLSVSTGICDESELVDKIKAARLQGERIVMTNGCFDILHPGHIQYLKQAKNLGDRLVVAVNSDASISKIKGPTRPITPLRSRLEMLAAYDFVDWVVPFDEDTPERLYKRVLPDVLVKGGDYNNKNIAGAESVISAGGEVRILSYLPGYSTSTIIDKIRGD